MLVYCYVYVVFVQIVIYLDQGSEVPGPGMWPWYLTFIKPILKCEECWQGSTHAECVLGAAKFALGEINSPDNSKSEFVKVVKAKAGISFDDTVIDCAYAL